MKRWLLLVIIFFVFGCSSSPNPPPTSQAISTSEIATVVPFPTLLPTVTTAPIPAVATAIPVTETIAPTATRRASTNTQANTRFAAPRTIAPDASASFSDGSDIPFAFASVGALQPNQCYLLHIELAVPNLPQGNRGDDFLDTEHCGDQGPAGKELTFILYRGKFTNSPNYGTILSQTHALAPEVRLLKMTWQVRVVQNNGRAADGVHYNTVALSPDSPVSEFNFQP